MPVARPVPTRFLSRTAGAVVAVAVLAGCTGGGAGTLVDEGTSGPSGNVVRVAPADRSAPPEITGTTLAGDELDVADLRGDVVVLNVWGAWCGPCREEMPSLVEAARTYDEQEQPVSFVGLNVRDNEDRARALERRFDVPYPSITDHDGDLQLSLRDAVPPQAVPSTVLLDPDGRVAVTVIGRVTHSSLTSLVDDVLAESGTGGTEPGTVDTEPGTEPGTGNGDRAPAEAAGSHG